MANVPPGPKTGITLVNNDWLLVGSYNAVIRSSNGGLQWDTTYHGNTVFSLFTASTGRVLIGGQGAVLFSDDKGLTWDSVQTGIEYPIKKFIETPNGMIFAITNDVHDLFGQVGSGVFCSTDQGSTWTERNNGLGIYLSCHQIAVDKNGTLYLGTEDEATTGNGGLFISTNNGELWQHVPLTVDGKGVIADEIQILHMSGLSISSSDSVFISVEGIAVNASVNLNVSKHISDVESSNPWNVFSVVPILNWWNDRQLMNIHFAANGDRYSSVMGSAQSGGSFIKRKDSNDWIQSNQGLGLGPMGWHYELFHVERSNGEIFMIQFADDNIYRNNATVPTTINEPITPTPISNAYPNPVQAGGLVEFKNLPTDVTGTYQVVDLTGVVYSSGTLESVCQGIVAPTITGAWFVQIVTPIGTTMYPIMVK